jgi:hypothetical protein
MTAVRDIIAALGNIQPSEAEETVSHLTLKEFVKALGSEAIAPGCGAAGALTLALAAGCAAKAFALSARHNHIERLSKAATESRIIALIALEGARRDSRDFREWLMSHASKASAEALDRDAQILFGVARALEVLVSANGQDVIETLAPDIAAAKDLLAAFNAIEVRNRAIDYKMT